MTEDYTARGAERLPRGTMGRLASDDQVADGDEVHAEARFPGAVVRPCCPPGEGCNSPGRDQPCALTTLRRDSRPEAQRAVRLWADYEQQIDDLPNVVT